MLKSQLDYILKVRVPIAAFVVVVTYIITFFVSKPERDGVGYAPEQPINFSHKLHAGDMQIDCKYCHIGVEKGRFATIPSTNICMGCHSVARKDKPEIIRLSQMFMDNIPIKWKRIHRLGDFAYFNHSVHINKGIECKYCHGEVEKMDVVQQVHRLTMGACLDCHRNPHKNMPDLKAQVSKGPEYCGSCHR
ncbi:MAG: cytochrome c family protein [Ignavibacteria bacterium]|nr:cytochrome c family protein [Ignavibacteria bacterium]